jgi:hypothetical protein
MWSLLYPASLRMLSLHKASALAFACKHDNVKVSQSAVVKTVVKNMTMSRLASPPLFPPSAFLLYTFLSVHVPALSYGVSGFGFGFRV